MNQLNEVNESLAQQLKGCLRGKSPAQVEAFCAHDWKQAARFELQRRATRFLEGLPDETLALVVSGEADLVALARRIAAP